MKKPLAVVLLLFAGGLVAQTTEEALRQCRSEKNDLRRLLCYDAIGKAGQQENHLQQAVIPPVASTAQQAEAKDNFGFEHRRIETKGPDKRYVTIVRQKKLATGQWQFWLDNGQLWRQVGSDRLPPQDAGPAYIERGVLNSFFLGRDNSNRRVRVKRIK